MDSIEAHTISDNHKRTWSASFNETEPTSAAAPTTIAMTYRLKKNKMKRMLKQLLPKKNDERKMNMINLNHLFNNDGKLSNSKNVTRSYIFPNIKSHNDYYYIENSITLNGTKLFKKKQQKKLVKTGYVKPGKIGNEVSTENYEDLNGNNNNIGLTIVATGSTEGNFQGLAGGNGLDLQDGLDLGPDEKTLELILTQNVSALFNASSIVFTLFCQNQSTASQSLAIVLTHNTHGYD